MNKSAFLVIVLFLNFTNSIKSITFSVEPTTKAKIILGISSAVATYGYIERKLAQKELNELKRDKAKAAEMSKKIAGALGDFFLVQYKKIRTKMRTIIARRFPTAELGFSPSDIAQAQSAANSELMNAQEQATKHSEEIDNEISRFKNDKLVSTLLFGAGSFGSLCSAYYLFTKKYEINFSLSPR